MDKDNEIPKNVSVFEWITLNLVIDMMANQLAFQKLFFQMNEDKFPSGLTSVLVALEKEKEIVRESLIEQIFVKYSDVSPEIKEILNRKI